MLLAAQPMPAPRVVLLVPRVRAPTALAERLKAELESLGFEVEVDRLDDTGRVRDVLDATERPNLTAVLALDTTGLEQRAIDVWVSDRATGKTVLRRLKADGPPQKPERSAAALALKAVELLRASLVELSFDLGRELPAAVKQLATPPSSPPSRLSLEAGLGASFVRGAAPGLHAAIDASFRLPLVFFAELLGRMTLVPSRVAVMGGASVQIHEQSALLGVGGTFSVAPSLELSAVVLAGVTRVEGLGVAGGTHLVERRLSAVSPSFEPAVVARWWMSPHWGVMLRAGVRFDASPTIFQADGVEIGVAGFPSVAASVMVCVRP
jgi:hypothetical protein